MNTSDDSIFPLCRAADLKEPDDQNRWLIESLLPRSGVSICGGAPKCCKSWMGLDLALSVASGTSCLDRFAIPEPAATLIYLAEDSPSMVRARLQGLCHHRGLELTALPIDVITAPVLRLDVQRDQERLTRTLAKQKPRLLLLDPFVRLHRIDENSAAEVSALLSFLRELQREHDLAIVIIHHARKSGAAGTQSGQGLRGSGDFYAFVDSLFYLKRQHSQLTLTVEHRAAAAPPVLQLALATTDPEDVHLRILDTAAQAQPHAQDTTRPLQVRILRTLVQATSPLSRSALRASLHCRLDLLDEALAHLLKSGQLSKCGDLFTRTPESIPIAAPPALPA